jgi:uncharacterized membrane protein
MTCFCIVLISISAILHALWNLIAKSKTPSGAFFLLVAASNVVIYTPFLIYNARIIIALPLEIIVLVICSAFCESIYFIGLGNAYKRCDMSLAYPTARALPVLMIPFITYVLHIGSAISFSALTGMCLVAGGCFFLPFKSIKSIHPKEYLTTGYLFILMAAIGITGYSIIDYRGMSKFNDAFSDISQIRILVSYAGLLNLFILIFLAIYVFLNRQERKKVKEIYKFNLKYTILVGLICTTSYGLVLFAMLFSENVSYIAAFRQLSIPIGALLGFVILKEKFSKNKAFAIAFIVLGLILVTLK